MKTKYILSSLIAVLVLSTYAAAFAPPAISTIDFSGDGDVDEKDASLWIANFGKQAVEPSVIQYDLDKNGWVDVFDIVEFNSILAQYDINSDGVYDAEDRKL